MNLPYGPFSIIYADPPWAYNNCIVTTGESVNSTSKFHYPTMSIEEIESVPVKKISATDALLFLWTTCPFLEYALRVGSSWGFTYKTVAFVWEKMRVNPGFYTMGSTELCLVFKKGKIPTPRGARNIRQFYQASPGEHSVKPRRFVKELTPCFQIRSCYDSKCSRVAKLLDGLYGAINHKEKNWSFRISNKLRYMVIKAERLVRSLVMISYEKAREMHKYLWTTYTEAYDMSGGYVDQDDLKKLLESPTKKTARDAYLNQIYYWFEVGPEDTRKINWDDPVVQKIATEIGATP